MLDITKCEKLLYVNETEALLSVFSTRDGEKICLFAESVKINSDNKVQLIRELVTHCCNFLEVYINEVNLVFDDANISSKTYLDISFDNCKNNEELKTLIFDYLNNDKIFYYEDSLKVTKVNFDKNNNTAEATFTINISNRELVQEVIGIVKKCNLSPITVTNAYNLIASEKTKKEIIFEIQPNKINATKYHNCKIVESKVLNFNMKSVYQRLADTYELSLNETLKAVSLLRQLSKIKDKNVNIIGIFSQTFRKVKYVTLWEFIEKLKEFFINSFSKSVSEVNGLNEYSNRIIYSNKYWNIIPLIKPDNYQSYNSSTITEVIGFEELKPKTKMIMQSFGVNKNMNSEEFNASMSESLVTKTETIADNK